MIRKITPNHPQKVTNWGNHKSDTMAKVQHFSGISKGIPVEGVDVYDLFRGTFENSELGRMRRLLPLHEMAVNFGLVSNHPVRNLIWSVPTTSIDGWGIRLLSHSTHVYCCNTITYNDFT